MKYVERVYDPLSSRAGPRFPILERHAGQSAPQLPERTPICMPRYQHVFTTITRLLPSQRIRSFRI